jgi:hypothetical protein
MSPKAIIEMLINGNLTDAKEKAKKCSTWKLLTAAENLGYPIVLQVAIAGYLKGQINFQKLCNIMGEPN